MTRQDLVSVLQAGWWARLFFRPPCQPVLPVELEKIMATQGAGQAALGSGAVGQVGTLFSLSALDLGLGLGDLDLDLGFLFRSSPAVTLRACPSCLFPAMCHERAELAFLEASSLCGELTRDAGRRQLHNSRFSQLGCRVQVLHCRGPQCVLWVSVYPHPDACGYLDAAV